MQQHSGGEVWRLRGFLRAIMTRMRA